MAYHCLPLDPTLQALHDTWPPPLWEARLAEAHSRLDALGAVQGAVLAGMSEGEALEWVGNGLDRSTFRHQRERFAAQGFAGIFNKVPPPPPAATVVTPMAHQIICAMRLADPHVAVERIAEVLEQRLGTRPSASVIKRVLATEKLNRPRGGGKGRQQTAATPRAMAEPLVFGGAVFLDVADEISGYSREMAEAIAVSAKTIAAAAPPPAARVEDVAARNERGNFTAAYNQARAKDETGRGRAFRSVEETRREVDLAALRLVEESPDTIQRKVKVLLALPYLTDNGKTVQLDDYRSARGTVEACGTGYVGETLERFLREMKFLALGGPLMEHHARFWLRHEPRAANGEQPAAFFMYVDGSSKPLWTHVFTKAGKVSCTGRVMPCLDQVLVHTGTGTPIYLQTFSGHASLVTHLLPVLAEVEKKVGNGWQTNRIVVMDSEGSAVGLLRALAAAEPKLDFVTLLKPKCTPALSEVRNLTPWQPFRAGDEIAEGEVTLHDSKERGARLDVRVVLVRRRRTKRLCALVTKVASEVLSTAEVAGAYFDRWPRQELRFRTFGAAHFKQVSGYGKALVTNVAVVTDLEKLKLQKARLAKRIEGQAEATKKAKKALGKARLALGAAKARQHRHDERVENELLVERPDPIKLWNGVKALEAERDHHATANAVLAKAEAEHAAASEKLAALKARLPELAEQEAVLESRREIYRADTELDRLATIYKLGFSLLCEMVLRDYFGGMRMALATFMRQILLLPGTRTVDGFQEYIRLACPPNREVREALEVACKRVTALKLRRNGLVLHMMVERGAG